MTTRIARVLAAVTASALLLTACGEHTDSGDGLGDIPGVGAAAPMPPGAHEYTRGPGATPPGETCGSFETLRPDDRTARERVPHIVKRGRLIVGIDQSSNLLSFRDPISGALEGFDVDIAREIARDMLGSPDRIEFRLLTSARRVEALRRGDVDVIVKTMSITCDRREDITFSAPYFQAQQRILAVRDSGIEGIGSLSGRRVCAAAGSTSLERIQRLVPKAAILAVGSWADCLVALQQLQVDAITSDDVILAGMIAQDPYLALVGDGLAAENYGVGIARSIDGRPSDGLVRQVNSTISRILTDGTWNRLHTRWFTGVVGGGFPPPVRYVEER